MKKIGISLSGGGSRGIAHLGILKATDEAGIRFHMVTGTSAGAIIGAFYCSGYSPDNIMDIVQKTKLIKYVRPALSSKGLLNLLAVERIFKKYIKNNSFDSLNIRLVVAATNVRTGTITFFHQGELIRSVLASCAVPLIFKPIELHGESYIDGGILNNLPIEPLTDHCDVIIGSNCNAINENYTPGNMRSLIERSLLLTFNINTYSKKNQCDLFIEPEGLKEYGGFDFSKSNEIFNIGYEYGKRIVPKIKVLLE